MQKIEPRKRAALLQQAVAQRPDAGLFYELATLLNRLGEHDAAEKSFAAVLELDPAHYNALHQLVRARLAAGDLDGALHLCERSLQQAPGNTPALATKSIVLLESNERGAAKALLDLESFVRVTTPDLPVDYPDADAFLRALVDSIHANPALEYEPKHRTARGGSRADLAPAPDQPEAHVVNIMLNATRQYRERLDTAAPHPFVQAAPLDTTIALWTNVLHEGGYHAPHIHPGAWLSGVFYINVPSGGPDRAGVLELGCPADLLRPDTEPLVMRVCPRPGLLVLFPSYVYHRTLPTQGSEERISIAFDLVPLLAAEPT